MTPVKTIPEQGIEKDILLSDMKARKANDADWRRGRIWSLVYHGGDEHSALIKEAYNLYFSENGLSPGAFPSLRDMEVEVVTMILDLLGGNADEVGNMTSGGTESILLALKSYRDQARKNHPEITQPEIIIPTSAHPAFLKAAHYYDLKVVPVTLDENYRADVSRVKELCNDNTICIITSAPAYPQGIVDPIEELAAFALSKGIGLHVDACLGGFILPFLRELNYKVPAFDFSVDGVTSISADLHKNGYAAKGASAVLYKSADLRKHQFFVSSNWPGGIYGSPTMLGTRPGGAIAAAWAAMLGMGREGYRNIAQRSVDAAHALMAGIKKIPGLYIIGEPDMSVFTFSSDIVDIFRVGDRMYERGWHLDRQNNPDCIHMIATPNHEQAIDDFLSDLNDCVKAEQDTPPHKHDKQAAMLYGVTANISPDDDVEEIVLNNMDKMYRR